MSYVSHVLTKEGVAALYNGDLNKLLLGLIDYINAGGNVRHLCSEGGIEIRS